MTTTVIDTHRKFKRLGATRSPHRPGPESELVDWFVESASLKPPRGCCATVFREPRLASGSPDLVVVYWSRKAAESWRDSRECLSDSDIRMMQYLVQHGRATLDDLQQVFPRNVEASVQRLHDAGMVCRSAGGWRPRSLSRCFAVRDIIAIEAKISSWASAVEQAFLNTWFASKSYVLMPRVPRGDRLLTEAASRGLGVWTREDGRQLEPAGSDGSLPLSYASWLFNEWAWRAATGRS